MTKKEIILLVILAIIAFVRFFFFLPEPLLYESAVGKQVVVEGVVSDIPDVRIYNTRFTVTPLGEKSHILVIAPKETSVVYGDRIRAQGLLELPENFMTDTGKEFNYERYLHNKDIYFSIKNAEIEYISSGNGSKILFYLFNIRQAFTRSINRVLARPESDLANGILLGERGGFSEEMRTEFVNTGTIHIIALSGYNITIVAENVMRALGFFFAQTVSVTIGGIFVVLFVLLAGAQATAVRAGIMALIMLFARLTGRSYDAGRALVIAGLLMVAYDPRVVTDVSFQLSFLATFGILFITPKTIEWVMFLPSRFGFRDVVATTLSATIAVLPLLLYTTGLLSIVSLPANILILPLVSYAMFFTYISGMFGFLGGVIALPFAYISHLILSYILGVIHFFASFSFASITLKSFPLSVTFALYTFIIWWVFKKRA